MSVAMYADRALSVLRGRIALRISVMLFGAILVICVLIHGLVFLFGLRFERSEFNTLRSKGKLIADALAEKGKIGVMVGTGSLLETASTSVAGDPEVVYVAFYNYQPEKERANYLYHKGDKYYDFKLSDPASAESFTARFSRSELEPDLRVLDVIRPITAGSANTGGKDTPIGWVRVGLSAQRLQAMVSSVRKVGYMVMGLLVALGVAVSFSLNRTVARPITEMTKTVRRIGEGNLDARVETRSQDEIGFLGRAFNEMTQNIKNQIEQINLLVDSLRDTVELITQTSSDIFSISAQQSSGATQQAASVYQVSSTSKEISASATRIAETAEEVAAQARQTSVACDSGQEELNSAVGQVKDAAEKVEQVAERIVALGVKSQKISGIIDIINEISQQTNLLALNAAIEASGAGEAGKRFGVVASEIRRLAARTMEATTVVRELIEEIQSATNTTVMVTEQGMKSTKETEIIIERMNESFKNILELVEGTMKASTEITLSTRQQTTACEQMAGTIMEVSQVASEVEKGAKETEEAVAKLRELSDNLKGVFERASQRT